MRTVNRSSKTRERDSERCEGLAHYFDLFVRMNNLARIVRVHSN